MAIRTAENTKLAAFTAKAGAVPITGMIPPAREAARICTNRPVVQETEFAARRCSGVVSTGITAFTVGLKKVLPAASPAATRYACQTPWGHTNERTSAAR